MIPWIQFVPGLALICVALALKLFKKENPMSLAESVAAVQLASNNLATQVAATVAFVQANGDAAASAALDTVKSQLDGLTAQLSAVTPATIPAPPPAAE